MGLHLFCFVVRLLDCPLPPYFFSYLGLVLSHSRLWTRMSRNSTRVPRPLLSDSPLGIDYYVWVGYIMIIHFNHGLCDSNLELQKQLVNYKKRVY